MAGRVIDTPRVARPAPLDFLAQRENMIVVAPQGRGKTMSAKNLGHEAILAGTDKATWLS